ncbi:hypothetical protein ASPBRDRAFT_194419 [Aspergillus brasiliensis CBS 101740]|uniref:Dolichyl-diphosphooligosaccharide--protein glycosyltransferase subunit 4 n=1 Tax=Aspergillus brasiliensis (strain CBS 101740 / IMI 381727 / IBT 21946) TaxID=767769 RepID=A0A1L9UP96_ASPBC|nr:hypothetical protein ASPBRDRAFT_194419 [Aspergillus brasiliensis CBS 101740]
MITDEELHRLAVFLGSCAMMMIVLYHFLEVNAKDDEEEVNEKTNNNNNGKLSTGASSSAGVSRKNCILNANTAPWLKTLAESQFPQSPLSNAMPCQAKTAEIT